ncbi:hypothetical protein [Methylovulum psychrotolerans]|uniref:Uncharacterized protein n=1 Tax=Methylovulum psychrotolerans TaxID=1704499 RepID=A0A2S5CFS7_9GAMM|nr:hypothetical protein [Methylovulum psychrotolerans]POZ49659.1 hypothetical protein AADEFJLK_04575 [Methylovulum psychrotolerans]
MSLPIPIMVSVFQALVQAQNESDKHQREIQLQTHIVNLQHSYSMAKLQAEKEIIQNIISLAKHSYDRKMDFLTDAYHQVQCLISNYHQTLLAEQTELRNRRFDSSLSRNEKMQIESRLSDVSVTLIDLTALNQRMSYDFISLTLSINPL